MFTTSDDVPPVVTCAVGNTVPVLRGLCVHEALAVIENAISDALNGVETPPFIKDDGPSDSDEDMADDSWLNNCDTFDAFDDDIENFVSINHLDLRDKLRRDLLAVKTSGFKVGYLGHLDGCITISLATRIARLGISEEAMKVWSVSPSEYLVLLIRYNRAYQTLEELFGNWDMVNSLVHMRIGLCDSYKPSISAVLEAFQGKGAAAMDVGPKTPALNQLFIGAQLDKLLNERFLAIVKFRLQYGLSWTGAEHLSHASQGKRLNTDDVNNPQYLVSDTWATPPPPYLASDHMADSGLALHKISLPLLAFQFALRHFVRCTEFCLICHCKKYGDYEALRPYVCSNGLCLYQYIAFGMGPSLEYEILFQPYVVDLLVSLAYARARAGLLEDFPTGLGLQVPNPTATASNSIVQQPQTLTASGSYEAILNPDKMELSAMDLTGLRVGDWICIMDIGTRKLEWHCRVQRFGKYTQYAALSDPICRGTQLSNEQIKLNFNGNMQPLHVTCNLYNMDFDEMPLAIKRSSIMKLLDTVPSIDTTTQYLKEGGADKKLSSWGGITPPALDLLRWIVASNRSCIIQDNLEPQHLVSGMNNYIQFRLVQGAPDKEQRFLHAINEHGMKKKPKYPTIFGWHGSPVYNWHSILREGFHYKQVSNGRACGDGVYMSRDFMVSLGYCGQVYHDNSEWPQSKLKITTVISLNEIVNATGQFRCTKPSYVVQQLDWIQPRYLFVGTSMALELEAPATVATASSAWLQNAHAQTQVPVPIYEQDPAFLVKGPERHATRIPLSAFSSQRRRLLAASTTTGGKKASKNARKVTLTNPEEPGSPSNEDDLAEVASIMTAVEDLNLLLSDDDEVIVSPRKKPRKGHDSGETHADCGAPKTDFVPGILSEESLPLLDPPQYATSRATMALQKHLRATLKVQEKEPSHELGWYIDPNLIKNVYQWIVELHTFDPALPLAQDLKKASLQSVILELRFPPEFPMDPPFVRVIRPRFVEFARGGGGHVTQGGALCMELLTNSGWSVVTSIESLLLQVRLALSSTDPRPGRLVSYGRNQDYKIGDAVSSYVRACKAHGWAVPKGLERISW